MSQDEKKVWPDNNPDNGTNIERLFRMFAAGAMVPKPYKEQSLPASVTAYLSPGNMENLNTIALRLGATRGNIAAHILNLGIAEAAFGCGFEVDEEGNIPVDQKKWDTTPRSAGIGFTGKEED